MKRTDLKAWLGSVFSLLLIGMVSGAGYQEVVIEKGWQIGMISPTAKLSPELLKAADALSPAGEVLKQWRPAKTMPAMVGDILLQNGEIEEPWLPGRAKAYQWIAENDWVYATHFEVADPKEETFLVCKGLDTLVDVYLNGQLLGFSCDMLLPQRWNLTGKLAEHNSLVLHFHTVFEKKDGKLTAIRKYGNPARLVRRPNQNYSQYLGPNPRYSRVGIYDDVILQITGGSQLEEAVADVSLDETLKVGKVTIDVAGHSGLKAVKVRARLLDPDGKEADSRIVELPVEERTYKGTISLSVKEPSLWWPRGYGNPTLYRIETALLTEGDKVHQTISQIAGFRRVTMPRPLHFEINNVAVKLWGGDWVTPHWQTAVWDQRRVLKLIELAERANFNAFRVWGEVESPRDDFYELAARRGFMLWQDFTLLPLGSDIPSRALCCQEATQMIKRLKHYPSILVWCGGNESAMWHDPEYNRQLKDGGPWPGLPAAQAVGEICQKLDPQRYYQPSTPYFGKHPNDPQQGDTHGYTNMWFVPGYDYLNFVSEDTRISPPVLASMKKFMAPEDIWPADYSPLFVHGTVYPYPKSWLPYTTGSSWKKLGPIEQYFDADNAEALVFRLQMAEAQYYRETIERQRRGRAATDPVVNRQCGGYMVWKFNDSWPQIYSAKVDYFLEPKPVYYALRRAYAPVMLSFEKGAYITLWVVNDTPQPVSGTVTVQLFHMGRNEVRKTLTQEITVPAGESRVAIPLDEAGIHSFRKEHLLYATLTTPEKQVIARAVCLSDIERNLIFPPAKLQATPGKNGEIVITTDRFAHTVVLSGDDEGDALGWGFEDNYFDLMPGEEKHLRVLGRHNQGQITLKPWYSPDKIVIDWKR